MKKYWKYIILVLIIVGVIIAFNSKNFEEEFGNTPNNNTNSNSNVNSPKRDNISENKNENESVDLTK